MTRGHSAVSLTTPGPLDKVSHVTDKVHPEIVFRDDMTVELVKSSLKMQMLFGRRAFQRPESNL